MKEELFSFSEARFNKLFPFYLLIDKSGQLLNVGASLAKMCTIGTGTHVSNSFRLTRPSEDIATADLSLLLDQPIILESITCRGIILRGQFELTSSDVILFVGTPWFGTIEQVVENNLTIHDFAFHDPMIDLLHVLKAQEINTNEIKELLEKVNQQKKRSFESESQMSTLVQNLRTAILLEDETRHIVISNSTFCEMFGVPMKSEQLKGLDCELMGHQAKLLFKHEDTFLARVDDIIREKELVLSEKLEMKDGRILERSYIPIFAADKFKGHLWKYTDVTDRENVYRKVIQQEEKYRSIIENMNLGILEVDLNDNIQYANNSFSKISGYLPEEIIGRGAAALFGGGEVSDVIEEKKHLREEGVSDGYEIKVKDKFGSERIWFVSGAPNYNMKGELVGSIGIHLDVTEQKRLEQQLIIAKNRAEDSAKAKQTFLANMSHEIRTPLNAVVGMIRELKRSGLTNMQSAYLKHMDSASKHLQSIINNILDFSKIEAGEFALENQTFSLRAVFEDAKTITAPLVKEKLLSYSSTVSPEVADSLIGDPHRIRQIMLNIVGNAVKFTERGGITVSCSVVQDEPSRQYVHIRISDTGIGIEKDYLNSLFSKFTQESIAIARKYGGTGLGMAITYELVQKMGGHIHVQSEKGAGAQFDIYLTLDKAQTSTKTKREIASDYAPVVKGLKVLLVEDNEMNRLVASNSLSYAGIVTDEAVNGQMALEKLASESYDVVLMDLHMPVMDGLEATRIIRGKMAMQIPIIALSANAFKNEIDQCFKAGMNDYVTKPFDEAVLMRTIAKHAGRTGVATEASTEEQPAEQTRLYDLSQLVTLSHGNADFVERMIKLFCSSFAENVKSLQEGFAARDKSKIRSVAHKMKPALSNMGVVALKGPVLSLEAIEQGPVDWDHVESLISTVNDTVTKVVADLETRSSN